MNRRTTLPAYTAAAVLLLAAGGCSSSSTPAASTQATTTAAPAAERAAAATPLTADAIIAKFKTAKLPVTSTYAFTAANDPNHLLGRPNGYTAKLSWTDSRIPATDTTGAQQGDVSLGGSLEQFGTTAAATARETYIQGILKANPMLGTEYDYVVGDVLVRVSQYLTPAEAQAYQAAA